LETVFLLAVELKADVERERPGVASVLERKRDKSSLGRRRAVPGRVIDSIDHKTRMATLVPVGPRPELPGRCFGGNSEE